MRAVRVSFSEELLVSEGIDKKILMQILDLMPPDTRIIAIREGFNGLTSSIYFTSKHFVEIHDKYANVPEVTIILQTDVTPRGYISYVSHIDFHDTLETHWKPLEEQETIKITTRQVGTIQSVPVTITVDDPIIAEQDDTDVLHKVWGIRRR